MSRYQHLIDAMKEDEYLTMTIAKSELHAILTDLEFAIEARTHDKPVEMVTMSEALRRIKYEAVSLADAQVITLEALAHTTLPPVQPMTPEQIMEAEQRSYVDGRRPVHTTDCWGDDKTEYEPTKYFNMFMFARNIEAHHFGAHGITQPQGEIV
jgi:hypothetical protein